MQGPNPTEPVNYTSFSYPSTLKEVILVCTKAVNALTIGNENRLKMQVEVLAASTNETEEIINTRLTEKDRKLQFLWQRDELNNDAPAL